MLLTALIVLTLCFVFVLALLCAAPEGHEIVGRGFHEGPIDGCAKCRALDHALSDEAESLEARAVFSPLHSATPAKKG